MNGELPVLPAGSFMPNDIFATLLAAAGVPLPTDRKIDGVDFLPYVTGQKAGRPHQAQFWRSGPYLAVRAGDWTLQVSGRPALDWLFRLAKDPTKKHEVAAANPQKVAELKQLLGQFQREKAKQLWASPTEVPVGIDKTMKRPLVADDNVVCCPTDRTRRCRRRTAPCAKPCRTAGGRCEAQTTVRTHSRNDFKGSVCARSGSQMR
jgi:hypothetical protein